jgi:hypothetical protein
MNKSLFFITLSIISFSILLANPVWHPFENNSYETMAEITVPNSDNYKTTVTIDIPGFYTDEEVIDGASYNHISIPVANGGTLTEIGSPQLPVIARFIAIPSNRDPEIRIVEKTEETFVGYNVFPYQPPLPETETRNSEFRIDTKRYSNNTFYPEVSVTSNDPAIIRDYRVLPLIIQPVRYNPVTKELVIVKHLQIELIYTKTATKNVKTNFRPQISKTFEPFYRSFILNYDFVRPPQEPIDGSYLIITVDNLYSAVVPLAEWKTHKGWRNKIVKISDIAPHASATQIYNYIHNAYLNWPLAPDYVLLVGDVESLPCAYGVDNSATDHYYTKHEGSDYFADLLVSRVSVKNLTEAQTVINKLVNYESNPFVDSTDWYQKATTIGGYESSWPTRFWPTCIRVMNILLAHGYTQVDTLFQRWGQATPTNVTNAVNQGRSFVLYRGHGDVDGWYNVDPAWVNSHVQALNNGRKLPMVIAPTCNSGWFDDPSQDCHAEVWMKIGTPTSEKGACGYFGSSRPSYTGYNDSLANGTFLSYCDSMNFTFTQSTNFGKMYMYRGWPSGPGSTTELEFDMFNNFGDPELNIWSAPPQQLTVTHPAVIIIGSFPFSVTAMAGGPVQNALVCVMSKTDTSIYYVGRTNPAGQADFLINATTPGDSIFVTVTGRNLYPYKGVALTAAPNSPYVTFLRYNIDDSAGNDDGIVNPGEEIELPLWVKNWGGFVANSVVGKIYAADSLVTITDSLKDFGNIAANDSVYTGADGYNFTVSSACCNGHTIRFNLELCDALDSIWNSSFSVVVGTPVLAYADRTIYDSLGTNPNGKLDPGETADLVVALLNTGLGNGYNVSATLRSGDSRLTVNDSVGTFGTILFDSLGTNLSDCFTITASASIPQETPVNCTLYIFADEGYSSVLPFTIVVGEVRACDPIFDDTLYWAYEDIDTMYSECPTYEWVEINTSGTRLTLSDDQTVPVTLPATFGPWKFYGQRYTQLSICSNGWIAPGTQTSTAYLNKRLPDPTSTNPNGMVCGDWDDLLANNTGSGGVYWYHDLANHRFIVEYDSIPYYGSTTTREKFEIILLDTTIATTTGNNVILVMYMTASRWNSNTAGIENPTNLYGINMISNDTLNRGCGSWHPYKAIKYTTNPPYPQGITQENKISIPANLIATAQPNPFKGTCQIQLQVRQEGKVDLKIFDLTGREIRNLISAPHQPGTYTYYWNAQDDAGRKVANGIYFYKLETPNEKLIKKLILVQ